MGGESTDCLPIPPCDFEHLGEIYIDPTDCTAYYVCLPNDDLQHYFCAEGEMFDYDKGCVDYNDNGCLMCEPSCRFTCPTGRTTRDVTFIADKSNCGVYHICIDGNILDTINCIEEDPDRLYFDGNSCQEEESRCCDSSLVYCWEAGTMIPDPSDCHAFYICENVGQLPSGPYHCNEDKPVFDPLLGDCSPDASCTTTLTPDIPTTAHTTTISPDTPTTTTTTTISPDTSTTTTTTTISPDTPTTTTTTTISPDTPTTTTTTTISPDTPTTTTTTTISPDTTTTTTIIPSSCKDSIICEVVGPHPACTDICSKYYFYCDFFDIGNEAELRTCKYLKVLDPEEVVCVDPEDCPFSFKAMVPKMGVI
ncbi:hypothetical protein Pcinc_004244 [Petrolisthes cinctipes]|uniref:Chitin-binding type-2 domain-containing protein n=1 Tax=Petrolisthes cinctipes TaxID=88211 RepID=A0AAE1GFP0_PETCI|nr:hypothetical protein Pcinc_004244 [Petrolisthes cinctipes]